MQDEMEYVQFGFIHKGKRVHFMIKGGDGLSKGWSGDYELLNSALTHLLSIGGFKYIEPCKDK